MRLQSYLGMVKKLKKKGRNVQPIMATLLQEMSTKTSKAFKKHDTTKERFYVFQAADHEKFLERMKKFTEQTVHLGKYGLGLSLSFPSVVNPRDFSFTYGEVLFNGLTYYIGPLNGDSETYRVKVYSLNENEVVVRLIRNQDPPAPRRKGEEHTVSLFEGCEYKRPSPTGSEKRINATVETFFSCYLSVE